jgi:tRNA 2-thiouridine synthesizing protein A
MDRMARHCLGQTIRVTGFLPILIYTVKEKEMDTIPVDQTLDVTGLMCPMPLVKARQAILQMEVGKVLKVLATDKGSLKDFQGWAKTAKNIELLEQTQEQVNGSTILMHFVRRTK